MPKKSQDHRGDEIEDKVVTLQWSEPKWHLDFFKVTYYRHKPELERSNLYQQQELSSPKFSTAQISWLGLLPFFCETKNIIGNFSTNMYFRLHYLINIGRALSRLLILHSMHLSWRIFNLLLYWLLSHSGMHRYYALNRFHHPVHTFCLYICNSNVPQTVFWQ